MRRLLLNSTIVAALLVVDIFVFQPDSPAGKPREMKVTADTTAFAYPAVQSPRDTADIHSSR